ncbi:MAG: leucine-rich repeat domain-containing protein [Bacteroidaceae bacterium]|nr:leucine-rich repeat domain-containing protein [Bacteroidaceae bacterium]
MKKFLLIIAAIFCCTLGVNAQETPDYFCITNLSESAGTVTFNQNGSATWEKVPKLEYSLDGTNWGSHENPQNVEYGTQIDLSATSNLYIRAGQDGTAGTNDHISENYSIVSSSARYISISSTNDVSASGNIMSLLYGEDFDGKFELTAKHTFAGLFAGSSTTKNTTLKDVSKLKLPATTLSNGCYFDMFNYCSNITSSPYLPATELITDCYYSMFANCSKLSKVEVAFKEWSDATKYWMNSVSSSGEFICPEGLADPPSRGGNTVPNTWRITKKSSGPQYLCLTAKEDGAITLTKTGEFTITPALEYSKDGTEWTNVTFGSAITVANEELLYIRAGQDGTAGTNSTFNEALDKYISISSTGDIAASGCIMSLFNGDEAVFEDITEVPAFAFCNLFAGCTTLSNISKLRMSVTTLAEHCFNGMFSNTGIATIPATLLPATTLAEGCYEDMFRDCESLTTVPTGLLPATTLQSYCYTGMFEGCTELTSIPATLLPATTLATYCYRDMFMNCSNLATIEGISSSNRLIKSSTMKDYCCENMFNGTALSSINTGCIFYNYSTLAQGCFCGMFANCVSLVSIDDGIFPTSSSSPVAECYKNMFKNCVALQTAPKLNATTIQPNSYESMFEGCVELINAPTFNSGYITLKENSCKNMFKGCIKLAIAPVMDIHSVAANCCANMFEGCSLLNSTPTLSALTLYVGCYSEMFKDCVALETAPTLNSTNLAENCYFGMFRGCTSLATASLNATSTTQLYKGCYAEMFDGCEALETAPTLNSTKLAENCYAAMFRGCVALTTVPALPATTLVKECYANMFDGCTLLNNINVSFTSWPADESEEDADYHATYNWLNDVAEEGTFISPTNLICEHGVSRVPEGWLANPVELDDATPYTSSSKEVGTVKYTRHFDEVAPDAKHPVFYPLYVPFSITITPEILTKCRILDIYMVSAGTGSNKGKDVMNVRALDETDEPTLPHTPYIIIPYTEDFSIIQDNTTVEAKPSKAGSVQCATTKDTYDIIGSYTGETLTLGTDFILTTKTLAPVNEDTKTLAANRWYMRKTSKMGEKLSSLSASDKMDIIIIGESDVTGIEGISLSPALSTREGVTYNLQGQRVGSVNGYRGIVIKGGKKYIIK